MIGCYTGLTEPGFIPDRAHLAPSILEWRLPTEPWVIVVDGAGIVARFQGVVAPAEIEAILG